MLGILEVGCRISFGQAHGSGRKQLCPGCPAHSPTWTPQVCRSVVLVLFSKALGHDFAYFGCPGKNQEQYCRNLRRGIRTGRELHTPTHQGPPPLRPTNAKALLGRSQDSSKPTAAKSKVSANLVKLPRCYIATPTALSANGDV